VGSAFSTENVKPPVDLGAYKDRYLTAVLKHDVKDLELLYSDTVILLAGHEYLKPQYDLSDKGREIPVTVRRAPYLAAVAKAPKRPITDEQLAQFLATMTHTVIADTPGLYSYAPDDGGEGDVESPTGGPHFLLVEGDRVVMIGPETGDAILVQVRIVDGDLRIVAEMLD
jgi:hypothetical protein